MSRSQKASSFLASLPENIREGYELVREASRMVNGSKVLKAEDRKVILTPSEARRLMKEDRREWNHLAYIGQAAVLKRITDSVPEVHVPHVASVVWFDIFSWEITWKEYYAQAYRLPEYAHLAASPKTWAIAAVQIAIDNNPLERAAKPLSSCERVLESPHYVACDVQMTKYLIASGYTPYRAVSRMLGESHSIPDPFLKVHIERQRANVFNASAEE